MRPGPGPRRRGRLPATGRSYSPSSYLHLPSFADERLEQLVGFVVIGEAHVLGVPHQLAGNAHRDRPESQPLDVLAGHGEFGDAGRAAFAGADPILLVRSAERRG